MKNYTIHNGEVRLNEVKEKVRCKHCGNVIALQGGDSLLIKGFILFDDVDDAFLSKCHKCKTINVVKKEKNSEELLKI